MPLRRLVAITLWMLPGLARAEQDFLPGEALTPAGLAKFWQLRLPLDLGQTLTDLHRVDDQLFAVTADGYAFAIDAATGTLRWMQQVTRGGYRLHSPARAGDRAVFVTPATVIEYDWYYGTPIRRFELRFPAASPPASDGQLLFLGGVNQRLYAFPIGADFERWKVVTGGPIVSRPTLFSGTLCFASDSGQVFACRPSDKSHVWVQRPGGAVTADLVADENGVYVASRDNSLYLLDPVSGGTRWRARLSGSLTSPPAVTPTVAYQYCRDDGLVAITTAPIPENDRILWKLPDGLALLTVSDKLAYVLTRGQEIVAVQIDGGAVAHRVPAFGFTLPTAATAEKAFFIASPDGRVFCARDEQTPLVTREQILAALRIGTKAAEAPPAPQEPAAEDADGATPGESSSDALSSSDSGPPVGGKSKVSKQYGGGG